MSLVVEPASAEIAPQALSDLLWSTDPALNGFMFRSKTVLHQILSSEWPQMNGLLCHRFASTIMDGASVLGLLVAHKAEDYGPNFEAALEHQTGKLAPDDAQHLEKALYWMDRLFPAPQDGTLYILELAAAARARGKGIGSALIDSACAQAEASGCTSVSLDVAANNDAVAFYHSKGFETLIETRVPWLAETAGIGTHYHMVKSLM